MIKKNLHSDEIFIFNCILFFRVLKEGPLEYLLQVVHNLKHSLLRLYFDLDGRYIPFWSAAIAGPARASFHRGCLGLQRFLFHLNLLGIT